ncbi:unnamed protein product [Gadus morhua 'NCC']
MSSRWKLTLLLSFMPLMPLTLLSLQMMLTLLLSFMPLMPLTLLSLLLLLLLSLQMMLTLLLSFMLLMLFTLLLSLLLLLLLTLQMLLTLLLSLLLLMLLTHLLSLLLLLSLLHFMLTILSLRPNPESQAALTTAGPSTLATLPPGLSPPALTTAGPSTLATLPPGLSPPALTTAGPSTLATLPPGLSPPALTTAGPSTLATLPPGLSPPALTTAGPSMLATSASQWSLTEGDLSPLFPIPTELPKHIFSVSSDGVPEVTLTLVPISLEEEVVSTQEPAVFSPESVRPYPKASPRKANRQQRKKKTSTILTDTPEKQPLEEEKKASSLKILSGPVSDPCLIRERGSANTLKAYKEQRRSVETFFLCWNPVALQNHPAAISEDHEPNWPKYDMTIIRTCDNYKDACRIMEQYQTGCNTSDLQSEAEQECGPPDKRQRRPVHRFGNPDQSEEDVEDIVSQLEALPVLPRPSQLPRQTPLSRRVPGSRFSPPQPGENCPAPHHGAGLHHPAPALNMQRVTQGTAVPPQLPPPPAPALNMQPSSSLAYRPTWRGGRMADTIPCSAAEFQILSLLETIKHQNDQFTAMVNLLTSRMNSTPGPDVEMPDSIQFPLEQLEAVEAFEQFLKEPSNGPARQRVLL